MIVSTFVLATLGTPDQLTDSSSSITLPHLSISDGFLCQLLSQLPHGVTCQLLGREGGREGDEEGGEEGDEEGEEKGDEEGEEEGEGMRLEIVAQTSHSRLVRG